MNKLSAAQRRFFEKAALIGAQRVLFSTLFRNSTPVLKLSQVVDTASGGTPNRNNLAYFGGAIPWLKSGELNDAIVSNVEESLTTEGLDNSNAKVFPAGTLLIALYGATVGKTGILGIPSATNQAVCAVVPKRNDARISYLYWFLRYKREDFLQTSFGGAQPNISQRILRETLIPLPSPEVQDSVAAFLQAVERRICDRSVPLPDLPPILQKQRRVVGWIEELANRVQEARALRDEAANEAEALVAQEIEATFVKGTHAGWRSGTLGDYVVHDCYGTSEKTNDDDSGTPILRMGNIQSGGLDLRSLKYLHLSEKDKQKLLLKRGDIVVNRTNSAELVGKCAVFELDGQYGFASYLIRLRLNLERAEPRLVAAYINSPTGRAYMFNERKQMTGQANVNATKLKALPIALPEIDEQKRILSNLDDLQSKVKMLRAEQKESSKELDALMPSILDKAFRREL